MLVHTPRVLTAVAKGLFRRRSVDPKSSRIAGLGSSNPFVSHGRAGLFDVDQFMHMNNAAYLSHAEYARWEAMAVNGVMNSMYRDGVIFVVGNTAVRFRREIKPLFRKFEIHSYIAALDERTMWIYHTFRYPEGGKDAGRVRAQVVCQGHAIQKRNVIDPRVYFRESVGVDPEIVEELSHGSNVQSMAEMLARFQDLDDAFKTMASRDDEELEKR